MNSHSPLKIAFIWHHHQPYYKFDGIYQLPWVRMHAAKDYWDMVRILDDYPKIRQTFNFTPSLLEQIEDYIETGAKDSAYVLSEKDPKEFTSADKISALKIFFLANTERMIRRYLRYSELFDKLGAASTEKDLASAVANFSEQDFRDLQVWWNLSWVGEYSRFDPPFKYYIEKQRDFSELEKAGLLRAQVKILKRIIPHHIAALKRGQIEISISPLYHPILPLLCDTNIATEADPKAILPQNRFKHPEDASRHVKAAVKIAKGVFGTTPKGMWPSEGSVSDHALRIIAQSAVKWIATDESILQKTLSSQKKLASGNNLEKYFAYNYSTRGQSVKVFFRDHTLSDLIGFTYSSQGPDESARDFINRLHAIRETLVSAYGESVLKYAVVPVILDSENAWEFYQSDGKDFLRTLYYLISNDDQLETVLPSEVRVKPINTLKHIEPGSWINGNFDIWIGHEEDNRAWDLLYDARRFFGKVSKSVSMKSREKAYREILIAEGSDWCWWYGGEHRSPQSEEFDRLFRYHLKQVYINLGVAAPAELDEPINKTVIPIAIKQPLRKITPVFGSQSEEKEWSHAGFVEHSGARSSMQKAGTFIKRVSFGNDSDYIYLKIETSQELRGENLAVDLDGPVTRKIEIGKEVSLRASQLETEDWLSVYYLIGDSTRIAIKKTNDEQKEATLSVIIRNQNEVLDSLPEQGTLKFNLL